MAELGAREWLIIAATLLGPVLAVQAQKAVEAIRDRRSRKGWVFHTLMATRAARLSPEHVQALNMIDLIFYGRRILGVNHRTKSEQAVIDAWREYLDHLSTKADDAGLQLWTVQGAELFTNLLFAIANDMGYSFDRVQLKKGAYSPVAHGDLEFEQNAIRKLALRVLSGERALKMDVQSFPYDPEALKAQVELQQRFAAALNGQGALTVELAKNEKGANIALHRTGAAGSELDASGAEG